MARNNDETRNTRKNAKGVKKHETHKRNMREVEETQKERTTNQKLNYKISDRRPGDVVQIFADTRFANQELGWKAEKDLSEMLESAWKWEKYLKENET